MVSLAYFLEWNISNKCDADNNIRAVILWNLAPKHWLIHEMVNFNKAKNDVGGKPSRQPIK